MTKDLPRALTGLGLLLIGGLVLTAKAQDAPPEPLTHVLVTQLARSKGERSFSIQSVELATGKAENIFAARVGKDRNLLSASPSRRRFAISSEGDDEKGLLEITDRSGKVERSLTSDFRIYTLAFESDESVIFVERTESDPDEEAGHRLRRWTLEDGSTEDLRAAAAPCMDAVPLQIDAKGRWATYFSREGAEGLVLFDLAAKTASQPFPKGATMVALHPDGKSVSLFDKKRQTGIDGELDEKGTFKEIKVSEDGGFDYQYSDGFAARVKPQIKEGRRGASLELRELATKKTWILTEQVVNSDGPSRLFDIDLVSKTVIFREGNDLREITLISAKLSEKGLEDRKSILSGGYIQVPFLAR